MSIGNNSRKTAESSGDARTMPPNRLSRRLADQRASKLGQSPAQNHGPPNRSGLPRQVRYHPPTGQVEAPNGSVKHPRPVRQKAVAR